MRCQYCGSDNLDNAKFCKNCGAPSNVNQPNQIYSQQYPQPSQQPQQQQLNSQYYVPANGNLQQGINPNYPPSQQKKSKGKGCLIAVLIVVGVFVLLGVIGAIFRNTIDSDTTTKYQYDTTEKTKPTETTVATTIEESLIYDKQNVKIYVKSIEENIISFYIENDSNKNYSFNAHSYAVNGIMTRNNIYDMRCEVAAKSKANTELEIKNSFLKEFSITDIRTIDINFWVYDNEVAYKDFETGKIRIETNKYTDENVRIKSTINLYNKNDISIDYISHDGNSFAFCLTNSKDILLTFDIDSITINGYTISETDYDLYDEEVLNDCQYVFTIKVDGDFIEKNGIDEITTVQFNTIIRNNADYFDEWSTGNISVVLE